VTFSDALFAAIDRNVDAMIKAHGLSHLSREEAFRVLDDPDSVGIDRWENDFNEYGQHFLEPAVMPIAERVPRSAWFFWYYDGSFSDLGLGGRPHYLGSRTHGPVTHTPILGDWAVLEHETGKFIYAEGPEGFGTEVDILPSLELRAELMSRTTWRRKDPGARGSQIKRGDYRYDPGAEFLGVELVGSYAGFGRPGLSLEGYWATWSEKRAAAAFYEERDLPYGHDYLRTITN
jgi:hypothetical protein